MSATWRSLSLFAVFLLAIDSGAQTIAVSGEVRSEANAPIGRATIRIEGTDSSSLSNDQGHFELVVPESRTNRTITLPARIIGYSSSRLLVPMSDFSMHRSFALEGCSLGYWNPGEPAERFATIPPPAAIARASGLGDLRELSDSAVDGVRVWIWRSAGSPFDLFRFIDDNGKTSGEHISSTWSTSRCMHEARYDDACGVASFSGTLPNIGQLFICRRVDPAADEWSSRRAVFQSGDAEKLLGKHGRYDPRDVARNPHYLTIESWDGVHYRVGSYKLQPGTDTIARTAAERLASRLERIP